MDTNKRETDKISMYMLYQAYITYYIKKGIYFLPPRIIRKINKSNALHGYEPTEPPIELNSQPTEYHFKSRISPTKTSLVVSAIMGRLNHHAIDNGDVEVFPS